MSTYLQKCEISRLQLLPPVFTHVKMCPFVDFTYLIFTRMPCDVQHRQFRSLYVFNVSTSLNPLREIRVVLAG